MEQRKVSSFLSQPVFGCAIVIGLLAAMLSVPGYMIANLSYSETKGPFRNWMQVVDLDGNGLPDVLVSHTRWEQVDESWAGVGRWMSRGNGTFELFREDGSGYFAGFAGAAGDVDQDGDPDVFIQEFESHLLLNQGGLQGGERGHFMPARGGLSALPTHNSGYADMGGMITLGDLNRDGRIDSFVAGCCYGQDPLRSGNESPYQPSVSWIWMNDGSVKGLQTGHIVRLDLLDGLPIRQAALGDLDGDGDLDIFAAVGRPTMGAMVSLDDLVLLNDGTGSLTASGQRFGSTDSTSIALGDVNRDGRLDALVGTDTGAALWINEGNASRGGAPAFIQEQQSFEAVQTVQDRLQAGFSVAGRLLGLDLPYGSTRTKAVFLSDLDGDGDPDGLICRVWGAAIWWNNGQGRFTRSDVNLQYIEDTGVAVGDFDGDADQDIFIGRNEQNYQVWWNNGKGIFSANN